MDSVSDTLQQQGQANIVELYQDIMSQIVKAGGGVDVILNNYMNVRQLWGGGSTPKNPKNPKLV